MDHRDGTLEDCSGDVTSVDGPEASSVSDTYEEKPVSLGPASQLYGDLSCPSSFIRKQSDFPQVADILI